MKYIIIISLVNYLSMEINMEAPQFGFYCPTTQTFYAFPD